MSVKNADRFVEYSIKSILNQTYKDFNFLIIDDCSDDNTVQVLEDIKSKDSRITIFKNEHNLGLTKSLNKLIKLSNAEIIVRQDADDLSLPNRLETQINFMEKNNLDICTTRALIMESTKKIPGISYYLPNKILVKYKNPFIHGTLAIRKNFLNLMGNYDENFYYAQDYKLFSDILNKNIKIKTINKPLYVLNTKNNISEKFKDQQRYYANCIKKNITPVPLQS